MTLTEIVESLCWQGVALKGGGILLLAMTILQITPIKVNPWSWVGKRIGRAINGEVIVKVDGMEKNILEIKKDAEAEKFTNRRYRILRFGDELLHNAEHSKDHFDAILKDIDDYEAYCDKHTEFRNNITEATVQRIKSTYQKLLASNDFLH